MITTTHIQTTVGAARRRFEKRSLDRKLLTKLYGEYAAVGDTAHFISQALKMFPWLSCGVATVYLRHRLGRGRVVRGRYGSKNHTFLRLDGSTIVDITADQYGGPKTYIGRLQPPWSVEKRNSSPERGQHER